MVVRSAPVFGSGPLCFRPRSRPSPDGERPVRRRAHGRHPTGPPRGVRRWASSGHLALRHLRDRDQALGSVSGRARPEPGILGPCPLVPFPTPMLSRTITQPFADLPTCLSVRDFSRMESLRARRSDFPTLLAREPRLLGLGGVYVLWAPRTGQVYVGRADDLGRRIADHVRTKPWWTHLTVSAVDPRGMVAKEQWEWIESDLIRQVAQQRGWQVENTQRPTPNTHRLQPSAVSQARDAAGVIANHWLVLGLEALVAPAAEGGRDLLRGPSETSSFSGESQEPSGDLLREAVLDSGRLAQRQQASQTEGALALEPSAVAGAAASVSKRPDTLAPDLIQRLPSLPESHPWTRERLAQQLGLGGAAALKRGIFTPAGAPWFVIFATEHHARPDAPARDYADGFDFASGTGIYSLEQSELSRPRWERAIAARDPATGEVREAVLVLWREQKDHPFVATGWWHVVELLPPVREGLPKRVRLRRLARIPLDGSPSTRIL